MKKSKKPSKRDNQEFLRVIRYVQHTLKKITMVQVFSDKDMKHSGLFSGDDITKITPAIAQAFANVRCYYTICCGVISRRNGRHLVEYITFVTEKEVYKDDLVDLVLDTCNQMFSNSTKLYHLTPFYMAVADKDWIPNFIPLIKVLHEHQVLNLIGTNFEFNVNAPLVDHHTGKSWGEVYLNFDFKELDYDLI